MNQNAPTATPLYRFFGADAGLATLPAGTLRVGRLSQLNDPFEWNLGFSGINTPEEQSFVGLFTEKHLIFNDTFMGILCFTDAYSVPAHWSLYADKHRGLAFELAYPWQPDSLIKMTYSNVRPVLDLTRLHAIRHDNAKLDPYLLSLLDSLMRNKSPGFAFEQEYPLHIKLAACKLVNGHYEWRTPDNSFKRVILGFSCPLNEQEVRGLLDTTGFNKTGVIRAKMSPDSYSIVL